MPPWHRPELLLTASFVSRAPLADTDGIVVRRSMGDSGWRPGSRPGGTGGGTSLSFWMGCGTMTGRTPVMPAQAGIHATAGPGAAATLGDTMRLKTLPDRSHRLDARLRGHDGGN